MFLVIFGTATVRANDVEVVFSNGDVLVTGDSAANELEITRLAGSVHQFRGLRGTTINGSTDPVVVPIQDDLRIWMLGGEDFLHLRNVYIRGTSHADLLVEMGRDNDEIRIDSGSVRRKVVISDDRVFRGDDNVYVYNLNAFSVYIETQGSARIGVTYSNISRLMVESGLVGQDFLNISANDIDFMDVDASNENDHLVFIQNNLSGSFVRVNLNRGNDVAQLYGNHLNHADAIFNGNAGTDQVTGEPDWWGIGWLKYVKFWSFEN